MYNKQVNEALEEKRVAELALVEAKRGTLLDYCVHCLVYISADVYTKA